MDDTLCHCFGFTRADLARDVAETGTSQIPARIAEQIRAGNCACELKNPAGVCCLGDVYQALKEARHP
jgi:hypothetical protein